MAAEPRFGLHGAALRANWDATCDRAIAAVDAAIARNPDGPVWYLKRQRTAVQAIKGEVDGRRRTVSATHGTGILYDIPPELGEPEYDEAVALLDAVRDLFHDGIGAPGWDWSRGYPPEWPDRWGDRLRCGLFYRKK